MDHQEGILGHDDLVAGHGNITCRRGRDAIDPDSDLARMALQRVVDCHRIKDRAAGAVEAQIDGGIVRQRAQFCQKALGRDAIGADFVID